MSASRPILEVEGLSVEYRTETGRAPALREIAFALDAGESLGLVGKSGSGKTTIGLAILRHLADNGRITAGVIRFDGTDLLRLRPAQLRRYRGQKIAMVYQDPATALNPSIRIGEQLAEVFRLQAAMAKDELRRRTVAALERVHLPDAAHAWHRYPHEFSGGQQQRIVIAMALAMNPSLLILDEPTTGLDVTVEAEILDLFEELRRSMKAAILFISHNISIIARMCDRIAILHNGLLVETGPTARILAAPAHPYTQRLLTARIHFGTSKGAGSAPTTAPEILTAAGLSKRYHSGRRSFLALSEAALTLGKGQILGVVGESGSGKTTLARILAGLLLPDHGAIALKGRNIAQLVERRDLETRRAIQMVFQNPDSTLNPKQ